MDSSFLVETVLFLGAAVVAVPISKRFGIGAVLGYLVAGVLIGPSGFGLVPRPENVLRFSELGVALLLFVIGLELQPSRLWALRRSVFGIGSAQVITTGLLLTVPGLMLGWRPVAALVVGLALSLSSTAFVLQTLAERRQLTTHHGRTAFAILLFQDLAAIPLLAVIPVLGVAGAEMFAAPDVHAGLKSLVVVGTVVVGGRLALRPLLREVAASGLPEIFTAAALLVVIGTALIVHFAGLSMALGAFLAGVLLADSEFRHELEADIEPFKGLLLGLFFMAVGMSLNLGLVAEQPERVLSFVAGLMLIKAMVLYALGRYTGHSHAAAFNLALYLSQGGEFAFVIFTAAAGARVMDAALSDMLVVVVSVSLLVTPLLVALNERYLASGDARLRKPPYDRIEPREHRVLIAGFGRFGQIVARTLRSKQIPFTALETSFEQVDFVRKFGNEIYYGDASRLDLLRAARAETAEAFVLAIDDIESSLRTAEMVRKHYPQLRIYARARNRRHAYRLKELGVDRIVRETYASSLELARDVLVGLGFQGSAADEAVRRFRQHDEALLQRQQAFYRDEEQLIASTKESAAELAQLFEQDEKRETQ